MYGLIVNKTISAGGDIRDGINMKKLVSNLEFINGILYMYIFHYL